VIPLLLAAAYTTREPVVVLGPANLSALRVLVLIGAVRVLARGERLANGMNAVDGLLLMWATLLIGFSVFHSSNSWTFRIGLVLAELGVYLLCRVFIQDMDDVRRLFKVLCVGLVPLAAIMLLEKYTWHNYFGGVLVFRDGHVRAFGAFAHPILAGVVGASCAVMAMCLWRSNRASAWLGLCAGLTIVFASTSSGPLMVLFFMCAGLMMWQVRHRMRLIRWAAVAAIIALDIVMKDPVYFLIARIDLTGSSTGWFRSQLIRTSIDHLNEWWAVGTDRTRHWMSSGIDANQSHTDITNHFLAMGVNGGLPLLILFVLVLWASFRGVGRALRQNQGQSPDRAFLVWTLGAMLFGHVTNFFSISLFDQSASFLYLIVAMIVATQLPVAAVPNEVPGPAPVGARHQPRDRFGRAVVIDSPAVPAVSGWRRVPIVQPNGRYRWQ
jgi:hypothetical protein